MDEIRHPLFEIPYSDSGSLSDPIVGYPEPDGSLSLRICYERDGKYCSAKLLFTRVRAFRFFAGASTSAQQSRGAFDTLVRGEESAWIRQLEEAAIQAADGPMIHYLIYFSSAGCWEVVGDRWQVREEEIPASGPTHHCGGP